MSKRSIGSLADLARILEAASDPDSELREDRRETKPKETSEKRSGTERTERPVDPKRKAWYAKRLREQARTETPAPSAEIPSAQPASQTIVRDTASKLSGSVLEALASAQTKKDAKEKSEKKKPEAWRRKPGDPIF
jgi:hypothetical protein